MLLPITGEGNIMLLGRRSVSPLSVRRHLFRVMRVCSDCHKTCHKYSPRDWKLL